MKPKSGWKRLYADIIKIYNVGYGAILGRWMGIINLALLASTYLVVKGFEISFTQSIIVGIGVLAAVMISGLIYLKHGFQKAEFSSNFKEQPEMVQMQQDIEEIKKILKSQVKKID